MPILRTVIAAVSLTLVLPMVSAQTWDFPTFVPDKSFHAVNHKAFIEDVNKATNGKLEIKLHSANSLIKAKEIKNAVRSGTVPLGETLLSWMGNENPVFEVDSVPFLAPSYADAKRLWVASRPQIEALLAKQGLVVLYSVPWNPQGLFANKAITSLDDLKGLKFRTYNALMSRMAELAKAVPTAVSIGDVASAFQTGRIDAMFTSPVTGANRSAWDYTTYFYHTKGWLPKDAVIANKAALDALDPTVREAVFEAAKAAEARGWELSEGDTIKNGVDVLRAKGMQGIEASPELISGLRSIGAQVASEWAERAGADGAAIMKAYKE